MKKLALVLILAIAQPAHAATAFKLCMNRSTGLILAKAKCTGAESTVTGTTIQGLASVGPQGVQGPQGAQGPQGPAGSQGAPGVLNWQKCTKRSATNSGTTYVTALLYCSPGEFLLTHGVESHEIGATDLVQLFFNSTDKIAVGVGYGIWTPLNTGAFNTVTVTGVCCLP